MAHKISLLVAEDSAEDTEILLRTLKRNGFAVRHERVASAAAMVAALDRQAWDAVISDYNMPGFSGLDALRIVRDAGCDIPFILVSGTVGEEIAVNAIKAGANDYVVKVNLARIPAVLERELKEAALRAEHRKALRELHEREAGLRRAQAMARLAHVITGPHGVFESWSETLPRMIGAQPAGMPRSTRAWLDLVHPEDRAAFRAKAIAAARTGTRSEFAYRLRYADGSWIHIKQVSEPIDSTPDASAKMRWFGTLQDVTREKQFAETMRASEERHRALFEHAAIGIVHTSLEGKMLLVNPKFCDMTGYSRAEVVQLTNRDLTHPDDIQQSVNDQAQLLAESGQPYERELRLLRKDHAEIWVHVTTSVVRVQDGRPAYFISVINEVTERKRAEESLRESEARFRSLTELSSDFYWETDVEHRMARVTHGPAYKPVVGGGHRGRRRWEMPSTWPDAAGWAAHRATLDAHQPFRDFELARFDSEGAEHWLSISGEPVFDESGVFRGYRGVGREITERKLLQRKIERLSRVHAVLSAINAAIVRTRVRDELFGEVCRIAVEAGRFAAVWVGAVDRANMRVKPVAWRGPESGIRLLQSSEFSIRRESPAASSLLAEVVETRRPVVLNDVLNEPRARYRKELAGLGIRSAAFLPLVVDGDPVAVVSLYSQEADYFDDAEIRLLVELAGDLSYALDHIAKDEKVSYLALYDSLTGLANRGLFHERLGQALAGAGREGRKLAVLVIDIERLRTINESLGRQAGDAVIRQVAERLSRSAGPNAAARVTADQFVAVLPIVKGRSEAGRVAANFARACFAEPHRIEGNELRLAAKIGLSLFPNDGIDAETLLGNAEAALRKAKETGERQVFYTPDLTERTGATLTLENKLRRALEKDEFVLQYQPKVDLETRRIVGMEALIRWQSPELGLVPPMKFIPLMEETGMILDVGAWALKRASLDHRKWTEAHLTPPRVAVNVSAIQLRQRDFVANVEQAIIDGVAPTGIDLEITESLIMEDIEGNIGKLKDVRALGVGLAIDDFGTGYSSLSYLAKLPVQTLKIDRSFIITMLNDPDTMTLVQTIISLAHSLRLKVVAEGVDSEDQAKILRLLRCDELQGYLYSKPVPFDEMTALLKTR